MKIATVIVAAGRGNRAGGQTPKQWQPLGGTRVIDHAVAAFAGFGPVAVVLHADDDALAASLGPVITAVGGASRSASVRAGLRALADEAPDLVLVHDAARPLVTRALIERVIDALATHKGAAPAVEVVDALWRGDAGLVTGTQSREGLFRAQTPQGFHYGTLVAAYAESDDDADDDVAVARRAGVDVAIVKGEERNLKITRPEDFARAEAMMEPALDIRAGNGFDVHRFGPGDHVWLCGVKIPFGRGLQGHSDADVGMHAVTDAIYGALGRGDIGQHFPPTDPKWKGAASHIFLDHACALARELGFTLTHADCTLICEQPKIGPHAAQMKAEMARIMGLDPDRVSVKATTSERLGFTGREEGIAALATATLVKP